MMMFLNQPRFYSASKVAGEVLSHSFYKMFGLSVMIVRIFGANFTDHYKDHTVCFTNAQLILYIITKELQIYGKSADTAKDSTYIDDEVNGIISFV